MKPRKSLDPADNWQWRVSEGSEGGEWIDSAAPPPTPLRQAPRRGPITELPEVSRGGWLVSSFDLLSGTDVVDDGPGTVPAELFDELFPQARP